MIELQLPLVYDLTLALCLGNGGYVTKDVPGLNR
eukprot:COSAG05_NODE_527_length_8917_cov_523.108415_3_plen_34_part_00